MIDYLINFLAIIFGIYLILTYKWQTKKYAEWQTKNFNRKVNMWEIKIGQILNVVVGAIFISFGLFGFM